MSNTVNHCRTYDSNFRFCNSQVFIYITKRIWTLIYLPIALRVARAKLCLLSEKSSECDIGGSLRYCEGWGAGTLWDIYIYSSLLGYCLGEKPDHMRWYRLLKKRKVLNETVGDERQ